MIKWWIKLLIHSQSQMVLQQLSFCEWISNYIPYFTGHMWFLIHTGIEPNSYQQTGSLTYTTINSADMMSDVIISTLLPRSRRSNHYYAVWFMSCYPYKCLATYKCKYKYKVGLVYHDDVIKWKYFPRYWPFVRGIHRSPVKSPHKGQRRGALMFSLICSRINSWVNNLEAGELRRHRPHYDVTVMWI